MPVWERLRAVFGLAPAAPRPGRAAESIASDGTEPDNTDQALPTLAAILTLLGENSFDLDSVAAATARDRFERWAAHVADGAPPPERLVGAAAPRGRRLRDWVGLKGFVERQRRAERGFVVKSGQEMRETLLIFIQRLSNSFSLDRSSDGRMDVQLLRLKTACTQVSISELKRQVLGAVEEIHGLVEERAERHRREMADTMRELDNARRELDKSRRESILDPLTQLFNRGFFDEQIRTTAAAHMITREPCTLMMVDLDGFKEINDRLGHQGGDEALKALADCMVRTLPRKTDFIARYGGDEFAVIFQRDGMPDARLLAQKLLDAVREIRVSWEGKEAQLRLSIGLAELEDGETQAEWLQRADQALYEAKRAGKDQVRESGAEPTAPQR